MAEFNIPDEGEVKSMMGMLFDGLEVEAGAAVTGVDEGNIIGTYIDADDQLAALCVCDIEFAAFAGCSLTMLPKGGAEDIILCKEPSPAVMDNLGEVMNILSRLFIRETTPHLRYDKLYTKDDITEEIRALLAGPAGRVDLKMDIANYGPGNLSLISR